MTAPASIPVLPFVPVDDVIYPLPTRAQMEAALREQPDEFVKFMTARQRDIEARETDPFRHGYEPDIWHVVDDLLVRGNKVVLIDPRDDTPHEIMGGSEVYISGGNRSSKSEYAASRVVRKLVEKAKSRAWCFHTNGPSSIAQQQPRIYKYLPPEWRGLKKTKVADISYTQKNGFAGITPTFVAPNLAQCWFKNYAQDLNTIEGEELDICWMDELVTKEWIDAVRFRLATRGGVLIITFTAVEGYTATVKELLDGAQTVLEVDAHLLPVLREDGEPSGNYEKVPRVQQAMYPDLKIVYFHIFDNPFGNAPEIIKKAKAKGREGILLRCYGVANKAIGAQFPTFRREVHVISQKKFRELAPQGTNRHYLDPCSGRNWFMIWARALPDLRTIVIYREWPSPDLYIPGVGNPGTWAMPDGKKHDGKRGDAQKPWGFGLRRYVEEILRSEGWKDAQIQTALQRKDLTPGKGREWEKAETIWSRSMDSRFGAAPTLAHSQSITLIESMAELGMYFDPTPGEHQQEGIDVINDLLYFDVERWQREGNVAVDNSPRLLVTENCKNMIYALQEWTGMDGQHGACKDPVDLCRYLALDPPQYLDDEILAVRGGGSY